MAVIVNGDGILTGISSLATALTDLNTGRGTVTGVATVGTLQLGTGVSMSSPRSQQAAIFTNDTEFFTVDDAGRVGVGTITPNSDAHPENEKKINVGFITARSIAGDIDANTMVVAGISTFVGALNATSVVSSGAVSGTTGTFTGDVTVSGATPSILLTDTDSNPDYLIKNGNGEFNIQDATASVNRLSINSSGNVVVGSDLIIPDKIVHASDTNTAIRFPAADTVTVETGGSERIRITSDGKVGINDSTPSVTLETVGHNQVTFGSMPETIISYGTASAYNSGSAGSGIQFGGYYNSTPEYTIFAGVHGVKENGTDNNYGGALLLSTRQHNTVSKERLRITSGGLVGIATATPRAQFDVIKATGNVIALFEGSNAAQNHRVRIDASGASSTSALSISNSNSNNQTSMYHSGGNNNMVIMGGQTAGAEPTAGTAVATFASGGDVTVNTGNLVIGTAGKGIDFSATTDGATGTTDSSELLADYEEGTWTPTNTIGLTLVVNNTAYYTKVGKLVTVWFDISLRGYADSAQCSAIEGLPYAATSASNYHSQSYNVWYSNTNNAKRDYDDENTLIYINGGESRISIYNIVGGHLRVRSWAVVDSNTGRRFRGTMSYLSA